MAAGLAALTAATTARISFQKSDNQRAPHKNNQVFVVVDETEYAVEAIHSWLIDFVQKYAIILKM